MTETETTAERTVSPWTQRDDAAPFFPAPGVEVRVIAGQRLMTCWITLSPETTLPRHDHPHEQIGVVLDGAIDVTVGGETRRLGPGGAYTVPPHTPHGGCTGAEGCRLLESFTPPREDYLARALESRSLPE